MAAKSSMFHMVRRRNDDSVGSRISVVRLLVSSTILLAIVAAVVSGLYLRRTMDLRGLLMDEVNMHTSWLVAAPSEIQSSIAAASSDPLLASSKSQIASGPLQVDSENPRYFTDGTGKVVYLTGSHTWSNFQDNGGSDPPPVFDYNQYLDFLEANNHNFFRLWTWEESRWTTETADDNYWFSPMPPYQRTGPGTALDGKPKWDLNKFDDAYFDRMRDRIIQAGDRGIYVSIMLFDGWSVSKNKGGFNANNPWKGHPFNQSNNINGIDGDLNNDDSGDEVHELKNADVLAIQEAYVRKVIDTVNDLDNVLYEISNESNGTATAWQYHMIDLIKTYEAAKPEQHPVGMTVEWPNGDNAELFASDADWISPNDYFDPPQADGSKVIISDTDHLWGIGGDREWVWKSFTRGINPIFMDGYDGAGYGVGGAGFNFDDPQWESLRLNMGYTRSYAERINLAKMLPRQDLCSTQYCLANPAASGAEYLVYLPSGGSVTVNLSGASGELQVEWFNPETGNTFASGTTTGGASRSFTAPFSGDAILYVYQPGASPTPTDTPVGTPTNTSEPPDGTPTATPATPTATSTPVTVSINVGETDIMSSDSSGAGNLIVAQQVTLPEDATLQSLNLYVAAAAGRLRLGIYDDAGGNPGNLRAQTDEFVPADGWNTGAPTDQPVLPAGTYWLAFLSDSDTLHLRYTQQNGLGRYHSQTFGSLPATFPSPPSSGVFNFSFYATFLVEKTTPVPTDSPTNTPSPLDTPTPTAPILGDVSCDGEVTSVDAMFVLQYEVGMRDSADQCPLTPNTLLVAQCDVDGDGSCSAADALLMLQCSVGEPNDLCPF